MKRSWLVAGFLFAQTALGAEETLEPVVRPAPFTGVSASVAAETEFVPTKAAYVCGSKSLTWSQGYTSLQLTNAGRNLFRIHVWGGPPEASWNPYCDYKDGVDETEKSVERRCDFRAKGGRDAQFIQRFRLTGEKKVDVSFDFSDNIKPAEKPFTFIFELERAAVEGKTFTGWDKDGNVKKFVFGSGDAWPTRPCGVVKCVKLAFDLENPANSWAIEYKHPCNVNINVSRQGVTIGHLTVGVPFPFAFSFDLGREAYETVQECVVGGINFTGNNAMDVPQYDKERNVFLNPSFESGLRHWRTVPNEHHLVLYDKEGHTGRCSAIFPYYRSHSFGIPIEANKDYTLSFWAKSINGKKIGTELQAWTYGGWGTRPLRKKFVAEPEWKRHSFPIRFATRCCCIGGESGKNVIYDDFQLELGTNMTDYAGNPIGLQLKTDGGYNATCDDHVPANARLVVSGPIGAAGTVKVAVSDFFGRKTYAGEFTFGITTEIANGYGENAFTLPESAWTRGVSVVRCDVTPMDGGFKPFRDYLRLNRFRFADNTKKLHEMIGVFGGTEWSERYLGYMRLHGIGSCSYAPKDKGEKEGWEQLQRFGIRNFGVHLFLNGRSGDIEKFKIGAYQTDKYTRYLDASKSPYKETCAYSDEFLDWAEQSAYEFVKDHPWVDIYWCDTEPYHRVRTLREGRFEEYAKFLMRLRKGMKRANPNAKLQITGNCSSARGFREPILRLMKACKAVDPTFTVDWADVHVYRAFPEQPSLDADQLAFFKELDEAGFKDCPVNHGEGTYFYPMICSEWMDLAPWQGCGVKDPAYLCGVPSYDLGWGEIMGAAQTVRSYLMCYKNAPRLRSSTMWQPLGLDQEVAYAFAPAQAFLVDLLGDATFIEEIRFAPGSYAYVFDDGHGHVVAAVWKFDELVDRGRKNCDRTEMRGVPGLELFDMMGNRVKAEGGDGRRTVCFPLGMFPYYLRVAKSERGKLVEAIKNADVIGKGALPLTFSACVDSLETMEVTVANTLSREVKTDLAFGTNGAFSVMFKPNERRAFSYRLPKPLPFDAISDMAVPVSMSVGGRVESTSFLIRVLPVKYVKDRPDWHKIPAAPIANLWHVKGQPDWKGPSDFSASVRMAWSEDGLRLRVEARDDVFCADRSSGAARDMGASAWWDNDSVQFFFDTIGNGRDNARRGIFGMDTDDYGYELLPNPDAKGMVVYRRGAPDPQLTGGFAEHGLQANMIEPGLKGVFFREKDRNVYEILFPKRYLMPAEFDEKSHPSFALMVHDRDQSGEKGTIKGFATTMREGEGRSPGQCVQHYVQLLFVK